MGDGVFIDGDFLSKQGDCKHHCRPTCHPAQIGPGWQYGCLHPAWPMNRVHDFCPIVQCGGEKTKCRLMQKDYRRLYFAYRRGLTARLNNAYRKLDKVQTELEEAKQFDLAAKLKEVER